MQCLCLSRQAHNNGLWSIILSVYLRLPERRSPRAGWTVVAFPYAGSGLAFTYGRRTPARSFPPRQAQHQTGIMLHGCYRQCAVYPRARCRLCSQTAAGSRPDRRSIKLALCSMAVTGNVCRVPTGAVPPVFAITAGTCAFNRGCRTPLSGMGGGGKLRAGIRRPTEKASPEAA
jgi:hypothetical protein